jgi:hypothetical protein
LGRVLKVCSDRSQPAFFYFVGTAKMVCLL